MTTLPDRFWDKVEKTDTCWLWTGQTFDGYGVAKIGGRMQKAHRLAYAAWFDGIPEGLDLDHLCRVRHCVNPDHLEPVTRQVNILRGVGLTARRARQTHCKRGHEFTPENTYLWHTSRICRECKSLRKRGAA